MGVLQRRLLKITAWISGGALVVILVGIGIEAEIILDRSLFFGRLFALLGLVTAVITIGLWNEAARARNVIPVEEAWKIGAAYGANFARRMAREAKGKSPAAGMPQPGTLDWDTFLQTPINQVGQQDSPPIKWPPRQ